MSMNPIEQFFNNNTGRSVHKWKHYFEIYDRHFARFRGQSPVVVEFGVSQGGSLEMWKDYFGPGVKLYGIDINPECKQFEDSNVRIFIGDQADRTFLRSIVEAIPPIDVLIEDGGHMMDQQISTFEELFPVVQPNGVYLCEDLHTSYWRYWGGGYKRRGTFIEYSKNWIDALHAWHSREPRRLQVSDFTKSAHSIHFYDSVVVIEKRPMGPPRDGSTGKRLFADYVPPPKNILQWASRKLRRMGLR